MSELLEIGSVIDGKYEVKRLLGSGGMGAVYEGYHTLIARKVAIKVLHPHVVDDTAILNRFLNEARITAELGCDNIVEVTDMGVMPKGSPYLVMEYLEGETLGERFHKSGALRVDEAIEIVAEILCGLAEVHRAGVIHRDLKPDNVFLSERRVSGEGPVQVVKLLDFGVSKIARPGIDGLHLTQTGAVIGTPWYMSPEQARGGKNVDHRTDIYATGLLLYEALTGQRPFAADNYNELMFIISNEDPPSPLSVRPDLPSGLEDVLHRALARDPDERFLSATEFLSALEQFAPEIVQALLGDSRSSSGSLAMATVEGRTGYIGRKSITTFPTWHGSRRSRWLVVVIGVALTVVCVGVTLAIVGDRTGADPPENGTEATEGSGLSPTSPAQMDAADDASVSGAPEAGTSDADTRQIGTDSEEAGADAAEPDSDIDVPGSGATRPRGPQREKAPGRPATGKGTSRPGLIRDIPF